jgi:tRNA-specific 2-thiouridylase
MLDALDQSTNARQRFPIRDHNKPEDRALAAEAGMPDPTKADSQDLCFLAGTGRAAFLARHGGLRDRPGDLVDRAGARVGGHRGHHHFTVGQRRGIGIGGTEDPLYVLATDADANTVVVGPRRELATDAVALRGLRLHRTAEDVDAVRLRYRSRPLPCRLDGDVARLAEPVDGAAPGQTAVLLAGDIVVGCATIA